MLGKKSVAVLDEKLSTGVAFNTLAHMALSLGKNSDGLIAKVEIRDASGTTHKGLSEYPFIILKADSGRIRKIVSGAKKNDRLTVVDFPKQAYTEYADEDFQKAVSKAKEENLVYYGMALFGPVEEINRLTKDLPLWK